MGDYTGAHTVPFHGFFFLILFSRRKSEAAMSKSGGGGIVFFRVPNSLQGCDAMDEARGGEYYISKPLLYSGKIYAPGSRGAHLG